MVASEGGDKAIYKKVSATAPGLIMQPPEKIGVLNILSSNVDCLKIKKSTSAEKCNNLGKLLGNMTWDILGVQENFNYDDQFQDGLKETKISYTQRSSWDPRDPKFYIVKPILVLDQIAEGERLASGIDIFLRLPTVFYNENVTTVRWYYCNGLSLTDLINVIIPVGIPSDGGDCMAQKGFRIAELKTKEGMIFHLYNIHMDAGSYEQDQKVRQEQMAQLVKYIDAYSGGVPVVLMGDFNFKPTHSGGSVVNRLASRLKSHGFISACKFTNSTCNTRIDQIWYRNSNHVRFYSSVDDLVSRVSVNGLSDHPAVKLKLHWTSTTMSNLARDPRVTATQSSTGYGGTADRAIDGNTDGNYWNNSVTHTENRHGSYLKVYLGSTSLIKQILIYNRSDCCGSRLSNFVVRIRAYDNFIEWQKSYYTDGVSHVPLGGVHNITLPPNIYAESIEIQLRGKNTNGDDILSLAEVEIIGKLWP